MKIKTYHSRKRRRRINKKTRNGSNKALNLFTSGNWKLKFLKFCFVGALGVFLYAWLVLPSVKDAAQLQFSESTIIYDRGALDPNNSPNDHILYVIHGDENREFVPLEEISQYIKDATIAVEDEDFYKWYHIGFDVPALMKAVLSQLGIGPARGGSTITQQLVKNTFLNSQKTFSRKFNELLLSIKMEMAYSKDEILEMYLNKIPYGSNSNGIEAASRKFFGKSSRDLTLAESAILAGLPNRPTFFSPYGSHRDQLMGYEDCGEEKIVYGRIESAQTEENSKTKTSSNCPVKLGRKDLILNSMKKLGMASAEEVEKAQEASKNIEFKQDRTDIKAPHFVFYVRQQLEEKYGKEFLQNGGLRIFTTLDRDLQNIAEDVVKTKSALYKQKWNASNVAMTAINPDNGEILAYIGGKDYFDAQNDGQVDVLQSYRQPGSSFKPFTFAAAFDKGYAPGTPIFDLETDFGGGYRPKNFDGRFAGLVSIRESLNRSLNVPSVKLAHLASPQGVIDTAKNSGIDLVGSAEKLGVAIGIGTAEVNPLSHINAYQVFVNNGKYFKPTSILEVRSSNGKILERAPEPEANLGISATSTALVRNILTDEKSRPTTNGFNWNKLLQLKNYDNGAKTGTSNKVLKTKKNGKDNDIAPGDSWTIGFTPHLVAGVWVGNNNASPMKPGATGMRMAAPIWHTFMTNAHETLSQKYIKAQKGSKESFTKRSYIDNVELTKKTIHKYTGKLASKVTPQEFMRTEVFAPNSTPIEYDNFADLTVEQQKGYFHSILRKKPTWEAPVRNWMAQDENYLLELLGVYKKEKLEELELMYGKEEETKETTTQPISVQLPKKSLISGNELARIISPTANTEIPVNSQFEVVFGLNTQRIKPASVTVEFAGKKTPLSGPSYSTVISTKKVALGNKVITFTVTDTQGNVLQKKQNITLVAEPFSYTKKPTISHIKKVVGGANIQVMYGARVAEPDSITLIVKDLRGNIFKQKTINNPPKISSFFLPKTTQELVLEVHTKYGDTDTITSTENFSF